MIHQTVSLGKYWKLFPATLIKLKAPHSRVFTGFKLAALLPVRVTDLQSSLKNWKNNRAEWRADIIQ